jgi:peptidoglycan/LPS O-acetylase OafA/YrhL
LKRDDFRLDIEGLRGLAVLLVLLFHVEFSFAKGGFIGVDIFFVLSGYLITKIILVDIYSGYFSFRTFYVRRIRRLFPALVATIVLTLVGGIVILSPKHLVETSWAALYSLGSVSNIYFSSAGGYFKTSSQIKPLLHTWSLSVEEQFYILWPFVLFVFSRTLGFGRPFYWLLSVCIFVGLAFSEYWTDRNSSQAYLWAPFRTYEFLLGAGAVFFASKSDDKSSVVSALFQTLGLVLIAASTILFDETTRFPGVAALLPAFGAVLIIVSPRRTVVSPILLNPAMLALGRISYSTYLVHWPIIVFARYLTGEEFALPVKVLLLITSVILGWVLYNFVEARFRVGSEHSTRQEWDKLQSPLLCGLATALVAFTCLASKGLPERMTLNPVNQEYAIHSSFQFLDAYGDGILNKGRNTSGRQILIFGDSMVQQYIPALLAIPEISESSVDIVTRGGCFMAKDTEQFVNGSLDKQCLLLRNKVHDVSLRYDLVVWAQDWYSFGNARILFASSRAGDAPEDLKAGNAAWQHAIENTVSHFRKLGARTLVFGPQVLVEGLPATLGHIGPVTDVNKIVGLLPRIKEKDRSIRVKLRDNMMRFATFSQPLTTFVDPETLICHDEKCPFHDGRYSYYMDYSHYSAAMTPVLSRLLRPTLQKLLGVKALEP